MIPPVPAFELSEWETRFFPGLSLSVQDRQLAKSFKGGDTGRLDIDELRDGVRIRARSWVGVIHFQNFEVRILPKLAGKNAGLVDMLTLTSGLDALRRNRAQRFLDTVESVHLLDLIALLFAEACARIVERGLLHDYVERESELPVLRGRLLVSQQVRQYYGRVDRLFCRYDDHLTDVVENQILAAALAICRSPVRHPAVRLQIRRLHTVFAAACTVEKFIDWQSARLEIQYHRMNEHYREAHELAWLLFESLGIENLFEAGQTRSFAFLLDMNRLFENFVTRFVNHALRERPYLIHAQRRDRSIIWDLMRKRPYTHVVPDLLIESDKGRCLTVDAKYKLYDDKRLSTSDIYQSFFYAYAYKSASEQRPAALLLYPSSGQRERPNYLQIRDQGRSAKANLQALSIFIPQAINEIKTNTTGPTSKLLLNAVEQFIEDKIS
ncbi:MAG: hypothetical protein H6652_00220 [Ardenticatenaceae bacterium]|nr:hypothetical protein [Ardenticatenaceae bacterium]